MRKLWLASCSASVDSRVHVVLGTGDEIANTKCEPGLLGLTFREDQMNETMNNSVNAVRSSPHPKLEAGLYGLKFRDDQMNETINNSVNALHDD